MLALLWIGLEPTAGAEEMGYARDGAALLFWQVGITADDGVTSASDTLTFFCCAEADAVVFGDAVGIVDPTFTPGKLTHLLQPDPVPGAVGVHPILLDLAGLLAWSPPSGPSLMTGQSAPMETGPLTEASFLGTLTTPLGDVPIDRALLDHLGGDTSLRRFSGGVDLGPPRLRASAVLEPLDSLEIDEGDLAGRVEMANPYEAVLAPAASIREAGAVSYPLASAAGLFWEITIRADDGVQAPSSDTFFALAGADAVVHGTIRGVVDPVFTPASIVQSIDATGVELLVGARPVTLDLSGALTWSPPGGPAVGSGQAAPLPTGGATAAAFQGTLTTPLGPVPFATDLAAHQGGDMTLTRLSGGVDLGPPRLRIDSFLDPLDQLEIDEADEAGRVEMSNPYEAILGSAGGVTWSMSARVFFNDAFHGLLPSAPNGALRDVTWSLQAEVSFNDVFYRYDPLLTVPPARVPALGGLGRVALGGLLLAGGLLSGRLRRR